MLGQSTGCWAQQQCPSFSNAALLMLVLLKVSASPAPVAAACRFRSTSLNKGAAAAIRTQTIRPHQTSATLAATRPARRAVKARAQPEQQSVEDEQAAAVVPSGPLQSWVSDPTTAYTCLLLFLVLCIGVFGEDHVVVSKLDAPVHAWVRPCCQARQECQWGGGDSFSSMSPHSRC